MSNIAILIPSFNSESTIEDTLASVRSQQDLARVQAVYLADDHSTDNTITRAERAWRSDRPLRVFVRSSNCGERKNVNTGIHQLASDVDWVLVLHSDDIAKSHWISTMLSRIEDCPRTVATICSSWDVLHIDGQVEPGEDNLKRPVELILGNPEAVRGTLLNGCWWHISGCAIRIAAFRDVGEFLPDMPQLGDWEWLLRCLARGWSVEYVPRTLILYRNHGASVSSNSFRMHRDVLEALRVLRAHIGYLSAAELVRVHAKRANHLLHRVAGSVSRLQIERLARAIFMLGVTAINLAHCLAQKAHAVYVRRNSVEA